MLPVRGDGRGRLAMPLNRDARRARARVAAKRRHHGEDADVADDLAALEEARLDDDIAALVSKAGRMSPEQRDRISRVFRYGDADDLAG
jgi:hypothetical protein